MAPDLKNWRDSCSHRNAGPGCVLNIAMNINIQSAFGAAIGLRARIVGRLQNVDPLRRKLLQSAAMLVVLGTIYSVYLQALWSIPECRVIVLNLAYLLVLLKFVALTGWPFALMAFLDETWSSKDAGLVFLAAFISTNTFWMHKYHHAFCPYAFAFEIFPYVFSATVGQAIGSRSHMLRLTVAVP